MPPEATEDHSTNSNEERDPEDSLAEKYDLELDEMEGTKPYNNTLHHETPNGQNGSLEPVRNGVQNSAKGERKTSVQVRWKQAAQASLLKEEDMDVSVGSNGGVDTTTGEQRGFNRKSIFLRDGDTHSVWRPRRRKPHPALASVVDRMVENAPLQSSLRERQRTLLHRVIATQEVLREVDIAEDEDGEEEVVQQAEPRSRDRWRQAKDSVVSEIRSKKDKQGLQFHDVVSNYVARMDPASDSGDMKADTTLGRKSTSFRVLSRQISGQLTAAGIPRSAPVPISEWKKLVEQAKLTEEDASVRSPSSRPLSLSVETNSMGQGQNRNRSMSQSPGAADLSSSRDVLLTGNPTRAPQRSNLKKQVVVVLGGSEDTDTPV